MASAPRTPAELDREVGTRLVATGQRYTSQRQAVVGILAAADRPLTTAEVVVAGDGLAQSSVYRNLSVLEAAGVVRRISGADEFSRYELAEDLAGHHHHLICDGCGAVADFTVPEAVEAELDRALARVARRHDFEVDHHRLDLVGRCAACS